MKLPKQFIEEISQFETIYCLVSGGYHSTTSALLLKDYGFENVILLHNKTFLERKLSIDTMNLLQQKINYKYIEVKPDLKGETVWDIIKRSLQKIPEVMEDIKNDKYDRKKFECCNKLKKDPSDEYFKKCNDSFIVVDSQCPYESSDRARWLTDLKNKNTFIRFLKKRKFWKAYPFRDQRSEKPFKEYLFSKGFLKIEHSGCIICPILVAKRNYNKTYYRTLKAMARAGLPCFQKTIEDYLEVKK